MDTIQQVYDKVKDSSDYPKLIQNLKDIGITRYEHFVGSGVRIFEADGQEIARYIPKVQYDIDISEISSTRMILESVQRHVNDEIDYTTFCKQAGRAGVVKWIADLEGMSIQYIDSDNLVLYEETLPSL